MQLHLYIMSNSIKDWLNSSKDYTLGTALYNVHSSNDAMKRMFAQGASPYRLQRLIDAMKELSKVLEDNPTIAIAEAPKYEPVNVQTIQLPENAVPQELDKYRPEWLPLFMERNHLRARLRDTADEYERGRMAHRILELHDQCEKIWERRDFELRTGEPMPLEEKKREPVTDPKKLHRHVLNLRSYITKTKNKLKTHPENANASKRLAQLESELKEALKRMDD
jgi:hypothetical protein